MQDPSYFTTPQGRRIAYHLTAGQGPGVVFLGGFKSNMQGTKALYLQDWAMTQGRAFLRFDYSGHGASSGDFLDGSIGDWFEDAQAVIEGLTTGPQVLVGSSMGGWIALRYAIDFPDALSSLILLNNAGVNGANESDLQKQAANEDYNPLVLAGLEDADRLVGMVVHKPPYIPARLKPVLYADALKYRDQLDGIFWVIANEGRDFPLNDRLGEVKAPTLIIWGRHDRLLDVSCVPVLEAGIAGSQSHIFEHVGHVPMIEDPKATAAVMKAFLAKH